MCPDETDVDGVKVVIDPYNQPALVTANIEYDPPILENAVALSGNFDSWAKLKHLRLSKQVVYCERLTKNGGLICVLRLSKKYPHIEACRAEREDVLRLARRAALSTFLIIRFLLRSRSCVVNFRCNQRVDFQKR